MNKLLVQSVAIVAFASALAPVLLGQSSQQLSAQNDTLTVKFTDSNGRPVLGANVTVVWWGHIVPHFFGIQRFEIPLGITDSTGQLTMNLSLGSSAPAESNPQVSKDVPQVDLRSQWFPGKPNLRQTHHSIWQVLPHACKCEHCGRKMYRNANARIVGRWQPKTIVPVQPFEKLYSPVVVE